MLKGEGEVGEIPALLFSMFTFHQLIFYSRTARGNVLHISHNNRLLPVRVTE